MPAPYLSGPPLFAYAPYAQSALLPPHLRHYDSRHDAPYLYMDGHLNSLAATPRPWTPRQVSPASSQPRPDNMAGRQPRQVPPPSYPRPSPPPYEAWPTEQPAATARGPSPPPPPPPVTRAPAVDVATHTVVLQALREVVLHASHEHGPGIEEALSIVRQAHVPLILPSVTDTELGVVLDRGNVDVGMLEPHVGLTTPLPAGLAESASARTTALVTAHPAPLPLPGASTSSNPVKIINRSQRPAQIALAVPPVHASVITYAVEVDAAAASAQGAMRSPDGYWLLPPQSSLTALVHAYARGLPRAQLPIKTHSLACAHNRRPCARDLAL